MGRKDERLRIRLGDLGQKTDFRFDLTPLGEHHFALGGSRDGSSEAVEPRGHENLGSYRAKLKAFGDRLEGGDARQ